MAFLISVVLLVDLWRRYFPEIRFGTVLAGVVALDLANFVPAILARCDVYEVAISCGQALMMLAVLGIWMAMHQPARRVWWLAGASLVYGLALGARPSLLFGAVILLIPAVDAWRQKQRVWPLFTAAAGPILIIGAGLLF